MKQLHKVTCKNNSVEDSWESDTIKMHHLQSTRSPAKFWQRIESSRESLAPERSCVWGEVIKPQSVIKKRHYNEARMIHSNSTLLSLKLFISLHPQIVCGHFFFSWLYFLRFAWDDSTWNGIPGLLDDSRTGGKGIIELWILPISQDHEWKRTNEAPLLSD